MKDKDLTSVSFMTDEEIGEFYQELESKQEPIPSDMEKILDDNLWQLYIQEDS